MVFSSNFGGNIRFNSVVSVRVSNFISGDTLGSEDLVVLKRVVESSVVEVGRTVVLVSVGVGSGLFGR